VVCRCEDVTRARIEAAVEAGARDVNQIKSTTRCGMGPCQGRICGENAADLLARAAQAARGDIGQWTARAPLRPLTVAELVGAYDYADIPDGAPLPG